MVGLMYPKDGVGFEEFDHYWLHEHSKIFTSLDIVKKNLLKYEQVCALREAMHQDGDSHRITQFHLNQELNQTFAEQGVTALPHYGMAIFEAETYEKILEVFAHPDYTSIVVPDELKFMNRMKSSLVAGQCAMILGA